MLAKRVIPCLDVDRGRVVKGVNFVDLIDAGDPVECARRYDQAGADELVFLDITASSDARKIMVEVVRRVADCVFIPFTVGGGIRTAEDIREILRAGADKVSLNTAAVLQPELITMGAEKFGTQCIVLAIDAKRRSSLSGSKGLGWEVYTHGGRTATGIDTLEWAEKAEKLGAGEILLTSMDRDGTQDGYDLELLSRYHFESANSCDRIRRSREFGAHFSRINGRRRQRSFSRLHFPFRYLYYWSDQELPQRQRSPSAVNLSGRCQKRQILLIKTARQRVCRKSTWRKSFQN